MGPGCRDLALLSAPTKGPDAVADTLSADPAMLAALHALHVGIVFQPQYALPTMQLRGFEVLARLGRDQDRWWAPALFLPHARAEGLMTALTQRVLVCACQALREWSESGRSGVSVAVNVDIEDLADAGFAPRLLKLMAEQAVPRGALELELHEGQLNALEEIARDSIASLRAAGVRLAIGGFGSATSCLARLAEAPFDVVKIDRGFLSRVPADPASCVVLGGVINMCLALGKEVVVEGVETPEQLRWLSRLRWRWMRVQGFALSFPLLQDQARDRIGRGGWQPPQGERPLPSVI